jgi:hypothetical protein
MRGGRIVLIRGGQIVLMPLGTDAIDREKTSAPLAAGDTTLESAVGSATS